MLFKKKELNNLVLRRIKIKKNKEVNQKDLIDIECYSRRQTLTK